MASSGIRYHGAIWTADNINIVVLPAEEDRIISSPRLGRLIVSWLPRFQVKLIAGPASSSGRWSRKYALVQSLLGQFECVIQTPYLEAGISEAALLQRRAMLSEDVPRQEEGTEEPDELVAAGSSRERGYAMPVMIIAIIFHGYLFLSYKYKFVVQTKLNYIFI